MQRHTATASEKGNRLLLIKCIWFYLLLEEVIAFSEFRVIYKNIKCVYFRRCKIDKLYEFKYITRRFLFIRRKYGRKLAEIRL